MVPFLASVAVISLSGVMMPGPAFAVTVAKSYKSPFAGIKVALGHALVEVPVMVLIYLGLARFFDQEPVQIGLYLGGGAILIWMGISMFRAGSQLAEGGRDLPYNAVVAGVVTTALNPFFILWWLVVGSMLIMKSLSFGLIGFALLITVHLLCDFGWLAFVSNLIYRTKSFWKGKFKVGLFIACSWLLVGFGGWFLVSGIRLVT
jgi:threonine/homoserine/homoserine lactone efflux protein